MGCAIGMRKRRLEQCYLPRGTGAEQKCLPRHSSRLAPLLERMASTQEKETSFRQKLPIEGVFVSQIARYFAQRPGEPDLLLGLPEKQAGPHYDFVEV